MPKCIFLELNDDCLLHIFQYLSVPDLGAIKNLCTRFQPLADYTFQNIHSGKVIIKYDQSTQVERIPHIFWCFGQLIRKICIIGPAKQYLSLNKIANLPSLIKEYCNYDLKEMEFINVVLNTNAVNEIKMHLNNLEKIRFDTCFIILKPNDAFWRHCMNLKEIVFYETFTVYYENVNLPNTHSSVSNSLSMFFMQRIFESSIHQNSNHNGHIEINEILTVPGDLRENNVEPLYRRTKLKRILLKLQHMPTEFLDCFAHNSKTSGLDALGITKMPLNTDVCTSLWSLTGLKILQLSNLRENTCLAFGETLTKRLQHLEELYLDGICVNDRHDISVFIGNLINLKKLYLRFVMTLIRFQEDQWFQSSIRHRKNVGGCPLTIFIQVSPDEEADIKRAIALRNGSFMCYNVQFMMISKIMIENNVFLN